MADHRNALQKMFNESNRYTNFGDVLMRMHVKGFRCHTNTVIDIKSPITAFCGLNGVGKSTLIQLAAAAYLGANPQETYYISNFIYSHKFDPKPFDDEAQVEYKYWQNDCSLKQLTLSKKSGGGWDGYNRRPRRRVLFVGIGSYLPKVEKSDFIVRYPKEIELLTSVPVEAHVKDWTCRILGKSYKEIFSHTFKFRKKTDRINSVQQNGVTYSEPHMGYGEARSQYLIRVLEALPDKSLILLEEPEISLHPSAQYQFGCYLVEVSKRKGHQIFLSTHSEYLLQSLPSQSRVYLEKTEDGIKPIEGLTALQAQSLMSEGHKKALHILVEDINTKSVAKPIISEIIRRTDPSFLNSVGIYPAGSCDTVKNAVRALKDTGIPVAAVLDADQTAIAKENIFTLPGRQAPEKDLFESNAVKIHIQSAYGINLDDFATSLVGINHHYWFERLAQRINIDELALVTEVSKVYVSSLSELVISTLTEQLKEASRR